MERVEVVNYLNDNLNRINIDMSDVFMIRNFIHLKHNKLIAPDKIMADINIRANPFAYGLHIQPIDMGRAMNNFKDNLKREFNITTVLQNGQIIKYV